MTIFDMLLQHERQVNIPQLHNITLSVAFLCGVFCFWFLNPPNEVPELIVRMCVGVCVEWVCERMRLTLLTLQ